MKLKHLHLDRLPGFKHRGFQLEQIGDEINIVIGPNGSGKTSICQAVRQLLWPEHHKGLPSSTLHSEWQCEHTIFTLGLENGHRRISAGGSVIMDHMPSGHLSGCFSITIDDLFDGKDDEFAQRIAQAMAGGYDIEAAQLALTSLNNSKGTIKEWKEAKERLDLYKQAQAELCHERQKLPALESAISEAELAGRKVLILSNIIKAKDLKAQIDQVRKILTDYPSQINRIKASDWEVYHNRLEKSREHNAEIAKLKQRAEHLTQYVGRWQTFAVSQEELERQLDRIGRMHQLQSTQDNKTAIVRKMQAAMEEHCRFLGLRELDIENLRPEFLNDLEQHWHALETLRSRVVGINEQIQLNQVEAYPSSKNLGEGIDLLTEMLSLPEIRKMSLWIVSVLGWGFASILFWLFAGWMQILGIVPLGVIGSLWWWRYAGLKQIGLFKKRYEKLELFPLKENSRAELSQHLHKLNNACGRAAQNEIKAQRQHDLENHLLSITRQLSTIEENLHRYAAKAGIQRLPTSFFGLTASLNKLHLDWVALKEANKDLDDVKGRLEQEWQAWRVFADKFNETPIVNVFDLGSAHARIKKCVEDVRHLQEIQSHILQLEDKSYKLLSEIDGHLESLDCAGNALLLKTLVEQLNGYHKAQSKMEDLREQYESIVLGLGEMNRLRLDDDIDALKNEMFILEEKAAKLRELSEQKGNLQARLEQTEAAAHGQRLLQAYNQKFDNLRASASDFVKRELLDKIISETRQTYQRDSQPRVLQQAAEWFHRFTKGKYLLQAPSSNRGKIIYEALDTTTNECKTLEQLSRGTRMQLLMAVRLAFAFENEAKDVRLPIFLDEVLSNTDPERFDAIVDVITELSKSGRQIFYFTCNPSDIQRWKQRDADIKIIDLQEIHTQKSFLKSFLDIPRISEFRYKKPLNDDIDAYAVEMFLPVLNLKEPLEMASIYYLVDNTVDLYRMLTTAITNYGIYKHYKKDVLQKAFPTSFEGFERRARLLEKFYELRTQGRGLPLTKAVLSSAGVSDVFIDSVWKLYHEVNEDCKQLLEAIKAKKIKGFAKKGLEQLREYLLQNNYLDERFVLENDEIRNKLLLWTADERERLFVEKLLVHTALRQPQFQPSEDTCGIGF